MCAVVASALVCILGSCTGRASARGPGQPAAHGPGFYDILRAGPGAGLNKGFNIHVDPTQREHYYVFKGKSYS